jgi:hypothetical protein
MPVKLLATDDKRDTESEEDHNAGNVDQVHFDSSQGMGNHGVKSAPSTGLVKTRQGQIKKV